MTNNKVVKIVKVNKQDENEHLEFSDGFTFNPNRKKINTFIEDFIPALELKYKHKYKSTLADIYTSTEGLYMIETDNYRLTVEIWSE